jgi:hypothetical protein
MRLLELFSGTQSVGKVARELGFEVVCLDRDMEADIKCDIMDWDYHVYEPGFFDVIWASPPCTEYSIAKTCGVRNIELANFIVQRTLDIMIYFHPTFFIIENPQTGLLKEQEMMQDGPYDDVDYCKYGLSYRKRTRLWNNIGSWVPRPLCKKDCGHMDGNRHMETAQQGSSKGAPTRGRQRHNQSELYVVPPDLLREIFNAILSEPNNNNDLRHEHT